MKPNINFNGSLDSETINTNTLETKENRANHYLHNIPNTIHLSFIKEKIILFDTIEDIDVFMKGCSKKMNITVEEVVHRIEKTLKNNVRSLGNFTSHHNLVVYEYFSEEIKKGFRYNHYLRRLPRELILRAEESFNVTLPTEDEIQKWEKDEKLKSTIIDKKSTTAQILIQEERKLFGELIGIISSFEKNPEHVSISNNYLNRHKKLTYIYELYKQNRSYFNENISYVQNTIGLSETLYNFLEIYASGDLEKKLTIELEKCNISYKELMKKHIKNSDVLIKTSKLILGIKQELFIINSEILDEV
ncbi:MAG: hypothetical protein GY828_02125 [Candidatus Gracilibacteria bacterium]|nr:hypothetical protein [Candidatus Gracilibacteria bacterium]